MDIMVDIETLGQNNDAVILSIGAVRFTETTVLDPYKVNVAMVAQPGRTIDPRTVTWWMQQSPEAKDALFDPVPVTLELALKEFRTWVEAVPRDYVWANGASFDLGILRHAYKGYPPWSHRQELCMRPLRCLAVAVWNLHWRGYSKTQRMGVKHDALGDAIVQAQFVQQVYKQARAGMVT